MGIKCSPYHVSQNTETQEQTSSRWASNAARTTLAKIQRYRSKHLQGGLQMQPVPCKPKHRDTRANLQMQPVPCESKYRDTGANFFKVGFKCSPYHVSQNTETQEQTFKCSPYHVSQNTETQEQTSSRWASNAARTM